MPLKIDYIYQCNQLLIACIVFLNCSGYCFTVAEENHTFQLFIMKQKSVMFFAAEDTEWGMYQLDRGLFQGPNSSPKSFIRSIPIADKHFCFSEMQNSCYAQLR